MTTFSLSSEKSIMANEGIPPICPSFILAQLNYMLSHSPSAIKVKQNNLWLDRFTFLIPYCLDYVKWDFIYNFDSPLTAPFIIFSPKDENFQSFILSCGAEGDKSPLANLACWNSKDPSQLLSLVLLLRELYSAYQEKRVGESDDERIKCELSTMLAREGIEMWRSSPSEEPEEVKFSVPLLNIDINKMVPGFPWRHLQKIYLQVEYPVAKKFQPSSSPPRLKLISTPELKALFPVDDVKLPPLLDGMCMAEYLPTIEDTLQIQIVEAVALVGARRHFIEALATTFGRPLEADPIFCRKATLLVANKSFTFLVHLTIPVQFPKQQPSLILQSSQHFNGDNVPIKSASISDYPWSARWEASVMAEELYEFLVDESVSFYKYCNESSLEVRPAAVGLPVLVSNSSKPEEVKFSVPLLDIDINKMVPGCPWRHQQKIYLQVEYPVTKKFQPSSSRPRLKLIFTPELKALFPVDDVKLPPWLEGMCMAEYLPTIEDTLQIQIVEAVALVGARRHFIEALATTFGRPLEADPIFCRKATWLVANKSFTFLVHLTIPVQFPKQQPSLILQSSQHFNADNVPIKSASISDYPWSARWEASVMAEQLYEFLVDESVRYCNESSLEVRPTAEAPPVLPSEGRSVHFKTESSLRVDNSSRKPTTKSSQPASSSSGGNLPKFDPASKYRSKSPGVKRFLGARV